MQIDLILWSTFCVLILTAFYLYLGEEARPAKVSKSLLRGESTLVPVKLIQKNYEGDTLVTTFSFEPSDLLLGIKPGQGIKLHVSDNEGERVTKVFYPISNCSMRGRVTVQDQPDESGDHEIVSTALDEAEIGREFQISGPVGGLAYEGGSFRNFNAETGEKKFSSLSFIASSRHISPVFQLIVHICEEGLKVPLTLIYYAETEEDFVLGEVLAGLAEKELIKLVRVAGESGFGENMSKGDVTAQLIEETLPAERSGHLVIISGNEEEKMRWRSMVDKLGFKDVHSYSH